MAILTIVVGIIFVLLLLSLLATTVMELISAFFQLRGRNLLKALKNMLASSDSEAQLLKKFQNNSLYKHLTQQYGSNRKRPPSYIEADTFQSILFDIILEDDGQVEKDLKAKIDELPDEDLKNVLNQLLRDADNKLDSFKSNIKNWYNDVMDRAGGWYKRYVQKILIAVGLIIAVIFNADTIAIYQHLARNPERALQLAQLAEMYVEANPDGPPQAGNVDFEESLAELKIFLENEVESIKSPLGLGWNNFEVEAMEPYDWLLKICGFIVTALAISLGAPFWFDLLRKVVNIRSSGNKPSS